MRPGEELGTLLAIVDASSIQYQVLHSCECGHHCSAKEPSARITKQENGVFEGEILLEEILG